MFVRRVALVSLASVAVLALSGCGEPTVMGPSAPLSTQTVYPDGDPRNVTAPPSAEPSDTAAKADAGKDAKVQSAPANDVAKVVDALHKAALAVDIKALDAAGDGETPKSLAAVKKAAAKPLAYFDDSVSDDDAIGYISLMLMPQMMGGEADSMSYDVVADDITVKGDRATVAQSAVRYKYKDPSAGPAWVMPTPNTPDMLTLERQSGKWKVVAVNVQTSVSVDTTTEFEPAPGVTVVE